MRPGMGVFGLYTGNDDIRACINRDNRTQSDRNGHSLAPHRRDGNCRRHFSHLRADIQRRGDVLGG